MVKFKLLKLNSNNLHANVIKSICYKNLSMSLIFTIFVVFIMSLLTQFLLNISHHDVAGINIALQGQRTLFAAKSGVTLGITNAIINQNCPEFTTMTLNNYDGMEFTVKINCKFINTNNIKVIAIADYKSIKDSDYTTRTVIGRYRINKK